MYCSSQRSSQGAHFDQMLLPFRETESPIWHESLGSVATQVHNMCEPFAFPPSIIPPRTGAVSFRRDQSVFWPR